MPFLDWWANKENRESVRQTRQVIGPRKCSEKDAIVICLLTQMVEDVCDEITPDDVAGYDKEGGE